jgi:phytoene desaturase
MSKRIVVIGAGFAGLAAAVRLAARGHQVTLVEKRDKPGGRAYVFEDSGYTFDAGPTVITAPWLLTELFELAGERAEDHLTLVPVNPFYRIFFDDGASFDYTGNTQEMAASIRSFSSVPADGDGYVEFLNWTRRIFDKGFTDLADKPFLSPVDMLKVAPDLIRLQSYRSVYDFVARFAKDERVRQVMSFHPLLVGGNPFQTSSIYTLIHYLEREWGVWFAMGGTGAIVQALADLFERLGGTLRLNSEVAEIATENGRATAVRLTDGTVLPADVVVCNADVASTYMSLMPGHTRRRMTDGHMKRTRYAMSLVVIYFGTDRTYRDDPENRLAHHNIILGPEYRELLDDIFIKKNLRDTFSLYLHMPTLTDPSLAPEGGESFYVLAPVPHLGGSVDWATEAKPYRDKIMGFLEERYLPGLSRHLVTERMVDPRYFRDQLNSYLGSAFSVEPILRQSAYFRPHNRSEELANLYLVGAGTHPGAGLPGVLSSARIADDLIAAEEPQAIASR